MKWVRVIEGNCFEGSIFLVCVIHVKFRYFFVYVVSSVFGGGGMVLVRSYSFMAKMQRGNNLEMDYMMGFFLHSM